MKPRGFHFLELPGEVRNKIYRLALLSNQPISMPCDPRSVSVQVLRLCRQVFEEATPIFYAENFFQHASCDIQQWDCPMRYRQHIRLISFKADAYRVWSDLSSYWRREIQKFPHLDDIAIEKSPACVSMEDLLELDSWYKQRLRESITVFGKILTERSSVNIWIIDKQLIFGRYRRIPDIGDQIGTDDNASDEDSTFEYDTSEYRPDTYHCTHDERLYKQRLVISQAILNPDNHVPFSVLLLPHITEEWKWAPSIEQRNFAPGLSRLSSIITGRASKVQIEGGERD